MRGQHLRVDVFPQPPEQRRRALNVGEQEREGLHTHSVEGRARVPEFAAVRATGRWSWPRQGCPQLPATGHFFTALGVAGLTGLLAALTVVLLAGDYATTRRVTV
jgi:hypothetical protein